MRSLSAVTIAALFFLSFLPFLFVPLWGSSEAREVHVTWSLLHLGDWLLPTRNGIVASKPPLFHWVAAVLAMPTGDVWPWSVRLVSLLSASVVLLCAMVIALRIAQRVGDPDPQARMLGTGFVLASSYLFFVNAADAKVDMFFTAVLTVGLSAFLILRLLGKSGNHKSAYWYLWSALAASVLAKGPLGPVLGGLLAFCSVVWVEGTANIKREVTRHFVASVVLLVPVCWYVLGAQSGGDAFVERHVLFENVKRIAGDRDMNSEAFWFYVPSLIRTTFPWSIIVGFLGVSALRSRQRLPKLVSLGLMLTVVGVLAFSIPSGKRHSYLLPLAPWFAVSAGLMIDWSHVLFVRLMRVVPAIIGILALGLLVVLELGMLPPVPVELMAVAGALFVTAVVRYQGRDSWTQGASMVLLSLWLATGVGLSFKAHAKQFDARAAAIASIVGSEALTVLKAPKDEYFDPILFYLRRRVAIREQADQCGALYLVKKSELNARVRMKADLLLETAEHHSRAPNRIGLLLRAVCARDVEQPHK